MLWMRIILSYGMMGRASLRPLVREKIGTLSPSPVNCLRLRRGMALRLAQWEKSSSVRSLCQAWRFVVQMSIDGAHDDCRTLDTSPIWPVTAAAGLHSTEPGAIDRWRPVSAALWGDPVVYGEAVPPSGCPARWARAILRIRFLLWGLYVLRSDAVCSSVWDQSWT